MMYLVTYTLNPKRDVSKVVSALQGLGTLKWWHFLDDAWLISTRETTAQLYERLRHAFLNNDRILIFEIKPDAEVQGWLPNEAWEWIQQNQRL